MAIKNIIFDVGNVIVKWSPTTIIEKTFHEHNTQQHQFFVTFRQACVTSDSMIR